MPAPTNEERLIDVQAVIAALSATILKLASKSNQSVSFGDQSYTIADIGKLRMERNHFREEEKVILGLLTPTRRRTIKVSFPSC